MYSSHRIVLTQLGICIAALAGGGACYLYGATHLAGWIWLAAASLVLVTVTVDTVVALWRRRFGLDLIALVSIAGAIALQEYFTAEIIALMFASGRALEGYAERRAQQDMSALLHQAPRTANRYEHGRLVNIALAAVRPGDRLAVRPGETVPVDGTLVSAATLDESSLTGESMPVPRRAGTALASGAVNAGDAFDMLATRTADDSAYANIVRLVQAAQASKAPAARLADRYALLFVPLALGIAGLAWGLSGDPQRALAVVVVATPCPLLLAVPVAIVSAMSRCARRGVLVKHGAALERMAQVDTMFFDKTGTLTGGKAKLLEIASAPGVADDDVLRLAASLAQMSGHAISQAVAGAAVDRHLRLSVPEQVSERPGAGLCGRVDGRQVRIGSPDYVLETRSPPDWAAGVARRIGEEGAAGVHVALDGALCGVLRLQDEIRLESPRTLRMLRALGIGRIVMLTGDRPDVAGTVGAALGVDDVVAGQSPASKLAAIAAARTHGVTMMVGDGVNDAPALAAADIGVAMGARGAAAAAESAQVVLLVDRLDRLAFAVRIARQSRAIALQSVLGGMGLSVAAMGVAAFGYLPPVAGALLQELIDVAVIANALRVLRLEGGAGREQMSTRELGQLKEEHARLMPVIDRLGRLADEVATRPAAAVRDELAALNEALRRQILPHEASDDATLYPRVARMIGGEDPMAAMSRTHREIHRLSGILDRLSRAPPEPGGAVTSLHELRRTLYALDVILRLHFAQEDEIYQGLAP